MLTFTLWDLLLLLFAASVGIGIVLPVAVNKLRRSPRFRLADSALFVAGYGNCQTRIHTQTSKGFLLCVVSTFWKDESSEANWSIQRHPHGEIIAGGDAPTIAECFHEANLWFRKNWSYYT